MCFLPEKACKGTAFFLIDQIFVQKSAIFVEIYGKLAFPLLFVC